MCTDIQTDTQTDYTYAQSVHEPKKKRLLRALSTAAMLPVTNTFVFPANINFVVPNYSNCFYSVEQLTCRVCIGIEYLMVVEKERAIYTETDRQR